MLLGAVLGTGPQTTTATEGDGGAMSCEAIKGTRIVCDSCGRHRDASGTNATEARIAGSRDGWKYVAWDIKGKGYQTRSPRPTSAGGFTLDTVPKQWDCCPDRPLPASPPEAKQIRLKRAAAPS